MNSALGGRLVDARVRFYFFVIFHCFCVAFENTVRHLLVVVDILERGAGREGIQGRKRCAVAIKNQMKRAVPIDEKPNDPIHDE